MSLNVYLSIPIAQQDTVPVRIYDANGRERELTRAEWVAAFPDFHVVDDYPTTEIVYDWDITHNLGTMAAEAGLYEALWRHDENGYKTASQLIEPLRAGLERLKADPAHFKTFNPSNRWGDYQGLLEFVESYLQACESFPNATVHASR